MSHIFISYVHENQEQVKRLSKTLRNHGMEVWLDRDSISPGIRWRDAIRQAIKQGAYFIACFSDEYQRREKSYMNEELLLAVDELRQYSVNRPWFIPVLLSECNIPALSIGAGQTLLDFQWVNLYSDWNSGVRKLLQVLKPDEIERIKSLIDELGFSYTTRMVSNSPFSMETPKKFYLESVHELREVYGILYDPLKLDHS